jgi:cytochrome c oxidase subunit I
MATLDPPGSIQSPFDHADEDVAVLDAAAARGWIGLAVGVLVLAGLFATLLVIGRVPPLDRLFTDPLLFRRGLVVHVDLALVAWFYCFLTGLWFLLPARGRGKRLAHYSLEVAIVGIIAMVLGAGVPGAAPVLSNYIPVIDHPVFLVGLGLLFSGVSLAFLDQRMLPDREALHSAVVPDAARPALRAAACAFLLAMVTIVAAWVTTPAALQTQTYYEFLFWGGGHILQVASVLGMLAAWTILLNSTTGRTPVPRRVSSILCGLLLLPMFAGPALALYGTTTGTYRAGFTQLMRWAIWPAVTVFFLLCVFHIVQSRREGKLGPKGLRDPRLLGFYISAGLTILGFTLGALIRGSNTMVPAHYHAAIGAVTASFMAVTWVVLEPLGIRLKTAAQKRWAGYQPVLFGIGQMVFAVGFGWAGAHGSARKTYGTEQQIHSAAEYVGLAVMGIGGLVAVAGGVLFLTLVIKAWRHSDQLQSPSNPGSAS